MASNQIWKYISIVLMLLLALSVVSGGLIYLNFADTDKVNYNDSSVTLNEYKKTINDLRTDISEKNQTIEELESLIKEREENLENDSDRTKGTTKVLRITGTIDESLVGPVLMKLRKWRSNDNVTGVMLWIDSPGGNVGATQQIYESIKKFSLIKPVVTYSGGRMLSGAYYLAQASDSIITRSTASVGSIGVLYVHYNYEKNLEDNEIEVTVFKTGEYKDTGAPWRGLTEDEKNMIERSIEENFDQFLNVISEGTGLNETQINDYADGSAYYGSEFYSAGMIDEIGGLEKALDEVNDLSGVNQTKIDYVDLNEEETSTGYSNRGFLFIDPKYYGNSNSLS